MKKVFKLLASALILCGIAISGTACDEEQNPEGPPVSEGGVTTINDAYDWNEDGTGSTRPNLGFGYEPKPPATEVVLTISEDSPIKFKGGSATYTMSVGTLLTSDNFDLSADGRKVVGVGVVNAEGKISTFQALGAFIPGDDTTIVPYVAPENGESVLFGSNKVGDYTNLSETISTENILLNGEMGTLLSYDGAVSSGSYFRVLTTLDREAGQNYAYYYTVQNNGEETVRFRIYQMHTGYDYSSNGVGSGTVTLKPGAQACVPIGFIQQSANTNALTLILMESETEGFSLGVSMAWENNTPATPIKINVSVPEKYKDTFKLVGYETNITTNDRFALPTADQIDNQTGYKLLYWVDEEGNRVTEGSRYYTDITITPVFAEPVSVTFQCAGNVTLSGEYTTYLGELKFGDSFALPTDADLVNGTGRKIVAWQDSEGNRLTNGMTLMGDLVFEPVFQGEVTVLLKLPAGLSVTAEGWTLADEDNNVYTGKMLEGDPILEQLPSVNTAVAGYTFQGWYVEAEGNAKGRGNFTIVNESTLVDGEITVAPYYTVTVAQEHSGQLWLGSAQGSGYNNNQQSGAIVANNTFGNGQSGATSNGTVGSFSLSDANKRMVVNEYGIATLGVSYCAAGDATSFGTGGQTRVNTDMTYSSGSKVLSSNEYTFTITIENRGTDIERMYFHFGNSGNTYNQSNVSTSDKTIELVGENGKMSGFVVSLKAGEVKTYVLTVVWDGADNHNTLFVLENPGATVENFALGVSYFASYTAKPVNVTFDCEEEITFSSTYADYLAGLKVGDTFNLPTAADLTNNSGMEIIGWVDGSGKTLADGTTLTGDLTFKPVFAEPVNVTFECDKDVTLSAEYTAYLAGLKVGDKFTLPGQDDITNNSGMEIIGWADGSGKTLADGMTLTEDLVFKPVFNESVNVTFDNGEEDVTLSSDYMTYLAGLKIGDALVLPDAGDVTNNSDKAIVGWQDADGNRLSTGTVLSGDMVLSPIFRDQVTVSVRLPEGLAMTAEGWTLTDEDNNVYTGKMIDGESVLAQLPEVNTAVKGYDFAGWYVAAEGSAKGRGNFTILDSNSQVSADMTIAPYYTVAVVQEQGHLWFGNAQNGGHNNSSDGTIVTDNTFGNGQSSSGSSMTLSDANKRMVVNENGVAVLGVSYWADGESASFGTNGQTRANTNVAYFAGSKVLGEEVYTFTITIENLGTDIERMYFHFGNSGTTYNQSSVSTADASIELVGTEDKKSGFVVSLKAGEVKTYVLTVVWDSGLSNDNTLFVIQNPGATVENFALGVSYAVSYGEAPEPEDPDPETGLAVSVRLPDGLAMAGWTLSDEDSNVYTGKLQEGTLLDQLSAIDTTVAGYVFEGWYIVTDGTAKGRGNFTLVDSATAVAEGMVIAPYYSVAVEQDHSGQLWLGSAQSGGGNNNQGSGAVVADSTFGNGQSGATSNGTVNSFVLTDANKRMVVNENGVATLGVSYCATGDAASFGKDGQTRVNTDMTYSSGSKVEGGKEYTFTITIENLGTDIEEMYFQFGNSQNTYNQSSLSTDDETVMLVGTEDKKSGFVVSLKAGEVKTYVITVVWDSGVSNHNTLFVIQNPGAEVENFALGVSYFVSYEA